MKKDLYLIAHTAHRGFTIVELLIVVVIIAILAAITIVAYNGIQVRANNSAAQQTLNTLAKKIHTYYTLKGNYPVATTKANLATELNAYTESALPAGGLNIAVPSSTTGTNTIQVETCSSGSGVRLTAFDFSTNLLSTTQFTYGSIVTASPCGTLTKITT